MTKQEFTRLAQAGTVLLDGATGSNLRAAGMPVGVCAETWILDHPEVILELQRGYVEAGSAILCAPTFSAHRLRLKDFGLERETGALNARLTALTREAARGRALVAGDLSTLGQPLEPLGSLSYSEAYDIYREHMEALAAAGVDLFALETLMGMDEAVAALDAAADLDLPVWCSFSAESDGTLPFGGNVREAAAALQEMGAAAVGVNCSVGPATAWAPRPSPGTWPSWFPPGRIWPAAAAGPRRRASGRSGSASSQLTGKAAALPQRVLFDPFSFKKKGVYR